MAAEVAVEPAGEVVRERSRRTPQLIGVLAALGTFAFLLPGAGRSFDQDSGLEVGYFVATHSIWDAFNKLYLLTNQVFFSFLDHLVYSATGSRSEVMMRLLPIAFAAVAVGLIAGLVAEQLGTLPAIAAAVVLATNPMFALQGSQVRGYSLVVLCAIVTTALFMRALATDRMSTGARICYAVVGAVGIATHLYMVVVLGVLLVVSVVSRRQFERVAVPTLASLIGLVAYIQIAQRMRTVISVTGRSFQPTFPRDLSVELLGGSIVAALITLVIVAPVAWRARNNRVFQLGAGAVVAAVAVIWLMAPQFLYPRFFLWLMPVVAVAVAMAVARRPVVIVLVGALVVLQVVTVWPRLTTDPYPNREAGRIFRTVVAHGGIPCAVDLYTAQRMVGYTTKFALPNSFELAKQCTVVLRIGAPAPHLDRQFDGAFPHHEPLSADTTGQLWSKKPITCWTTDAAAPACSDASR